MFLKRNYTPEIMDNAGIGDEKINRALIELKYINRFLGGNSVTRAGIKLFSRSNKLQTYSILDVGGGASDILLSIKNNKSIIFNMDFNLDVCRFVKKHSPVVTVINGNALCFPFKTLSFDIIHLSLFLHHFNEEQIVFLLQTFLHVSREGIIVNDLRRSVLAYAGIKIITAMFSKSDMVKNDGPLSVKRAFIKKELINLLNGAGIKNFKIKRKWAFRWLIVIKKSQDII